MPVKVTSGDINSSKGIVSMLAEEKKHAFLDASEEWTEEEEKEPEEDDEDLEEEEEEEDDEEDEEEEEDTEGFES